MGKKARKPTTGPAEEPVASEGVELPERWSVSGSRSCCGSSAASPGCGLAGQPDPRPRTGEESWKRVFLETGTRGLKRARGRRNAS